MHIINDTSAAISYNLPMYRSGCFLRTSTQSSVYHLLCSWIIFFNKMLKSAYHFIWVSHNLAPHNLKVRGHSNYDFCNQWSPTVSAYDAPLTHWGRVTHICVRKLTIIGSENGLSPDRRQAIIWTNAGILLIGPLGTNFSEIFNRNPDIVFQENTLQSAVCKMASILSRSQCVNGHCRIPTVWLCFVVFWLR